LSTVSVSTSTVSGTVVAWLDGRAGGVDVEVTVFNQWWWILGRDNI
jgi:hypothetical protein